jgi:hypothetical protein
MRGLLMALISVDFPGLGADASAGRFRAFRSTKTLAKKTTATTV